jgi:hypothetical protein
MSRIRYYTRKIMNKKQKRLRAQSAIIGDQRTGQASSGARNQVNVTLGGGGPAGSVANTRLAPVAGQRVRIGVDPFDPDYVQILSYRNIPSTGYTVAGGLVIPHANSHRYLADHGGSDPVWVELRQFMPLRVGISATAMSVNVYQGIAFVGGTYFLVPSETIDLGPSVPSTAGKAIYALVYVDDTGDLQVDDTGSEVDYADLALTDIPAPAGPFLPLAAVRLYTGQTALYETRTSGTDIVDLRFTVFSNVSGEIYTPTNVTPDRAYDANSTSLDEIADVLGTLIADLQAAGIIG